MTKIIAEKKECSAPSSVQKSNLLYCYIFFVYFCRLYYFIFGHLVIIHKLILSNLGK